VQALAAGFNGAKSNKGEDAAKWLKANPVKTVMGEKKWDSKGDLKVSDYVVYQWDKTANTTSWKNKNNRVGPGLQARAKPRSCLYS
jgi:branched-chain amino acid transport system substrate-binding protein